MDFADIQLIALDNILLFLDKGKSEIPKSDLMKKVSETLDMKQGLQETLLQVLFYKDPKLQEKAYLVLLGSWVTLDDCITDSCSFGFLYTCLYSILFIFSHLEDYKTLNLRLELIIQRFKEALDFKIKSNPSVDTESFKNLEMLLVGIPSKLSVQDIMERIIDLICLEYSLPIYIGNICELFKQAIQMPCYELKTCFQVIRILWIQYFKMESDLRNAGPLETFIRTLPFGPFDLSLMIDITLDSKACIVPKELDVISQGKSIQLVMKQEFKGSIQESGEWLIALGTVPSNRMYIWN